MQYVHNQCKRCLIPISLFSRESVTYHNQPNQRILSEMVPILRRALFAFLVTAAVPAVAYA